ncbi:unnamed protein product [Spodoptera exigua]|nr:unnamed protein product [Spodoptera exigua]
MEACSDNNNDNLVVNDRGYTIFQENFNRKLLEYDGQHQGSLKKAWTSERIAEVINGIKKARMSKTCGQRMTPMDYYWTKKYDIVTIDNQEHLVFKRRTDTVPVVRILPREDYFVTLLELHKTCGHGGRDKMLSNIKHLKYYVPKKAVEILLSLCPVCESKRNLSSGGVAQNIRSSDSESSGQVDVKKPVVQTHHSAIDGQAKLKISRDIITKTVINQNKKNSTVITTKPQTNPVQFLLLKDVTTERWKRDSSSGGSQATPNEIPLKKQKLTTCACSEILTESVTKNVLEKLSKEDNDPDKQFFLGLLNDFKAIHDENKLDAKSDIINVIRYYKNKSLNRAINEEAQTGDTKANNDKNISHYADCFNKMNERYSVTCNDSLVVPKCIRHVCKPASPSRKVEIEINPLALKDEQSTLVIKESGKACLGTCCIQQQSQQETRAKEIVFVKTEPQDDVNSELLIEDLRHPVHSSGSEDSSDAPSDQDPSPENDKRCSQPEKPMPGITPKSSHLLKSDEIKIEDRDQTNTESEEGYR